MYMYIYFHVTGKCSLGTMVIKKFYRISIVSFMKPLKVFRSSPNIWNLRTKLILKTHEKCLMQFQNIIYFYDTFLSSTYSSKRANTSDDGWWIVQRTVWPLCTSIFKHCMTLDAMKESRPEVGSSQNIKGGFIRSFNSNTVRVSFNTVRMIRLPFFISMNSFNCRQQAMRTIFSFYLDISK